MAQGSFAVLSIVISSWFLISVFQASFPLIYIHSHVILLLLQLDVSAAFWKHWNALEPDLVDLHAAHDSVILL